MLSLLTPIGNPPTSDGVFVWDELVTSDLEGAKAFYREVVGWTASDVDDIGRSGPYTMFQTGDTQRAGVFSLPPGMEAPPHWFPYLAAEDVDVAAASAEELGGKTFRAPFDVATVGRMAIMADSTGAVFGLFRAFDH